MEFAALVAEDAALPLEDGADQHEVPLRSREAQRTLLHGHVGAVNTAFF
jgi:hypothetical protein